MHIYSHSLIWVSYWVIGLSWFFSWEMRVASAGVILFMRWLLALHYTNNIVLAKEKLSLLSFDMKVFSRK